MVNFEYNQHIHQKSRLLGLIEILRFAMYDKYNRGFGGKVPEDSSHLIIRVFLFRFCFFFFHRNKKEKVNISLSVGLAKPTNLFLIYISLFNQTLSPTPSPKGEGICCICLDSPLILTFPPRGRNITFLLEILRFAQYDKYNKGFGGKAPEDSSHLIIRVFLFRFCFFFFHRNKKEKVNISLSVGLAKPTYLFLIYISLFNQALSPTPSPKGEGNCCTCLDSPLILPPNLSQNNSLDCFARQSPRRGELL